MTYKIVKRIIRKGWPTTSKAWRKSHHEANKKEKARFGKKAFAKVQRIIDKMPKNELLGSHTKTGKIRISSRVPEENRAQIEYHERIEHQLMMRKKRYR